MSRLLVRRQRKMLRGWVKWIPVLAIPFGVLFAHAWLNVQILRADYVLRELDKESKSLQDKRLHAEVVQSVQQDPEILAAQADRLAFVPPKPGQRIVIRYDPAQFTRMPDEMELELAQREPIQAMPALPAPSKPTSIVADPAPVIETAADPAMAEHRTEEISDGSPSVWVRLDDPAEEAFMVPVEEAVTTPVLLDLPLDDEMDILSDVEMEMEDLEVL